MAHSQPFTLIYQQHSSSDLTGSPADDARPYATFQWREPRIPVDLSPSSRQGPQDFYASSSSDLSPSPYAHSFAQTSQHMFQLAANGLSPGESRQIDSNIGPQRRVFTRRRSVRLQRQRDQDDPLTLSSDSRYDLRSTRSRIGDQFIAVTPGPHASEPIREYENYISSQFPSPASTASDGPWSSFQQVTSPSGPVQRAASPTSSTSNVSVMDITPPIVGRGKKRRVSNNDKRAICVLHHNQPDLRQQDIADRWLIERSTVSKILRNKDRWLSIDPTEKRTVYRLRDTKFPELEGQMQIWLKECRDSGKAITDSAIREKAKSLVPNLVLSGTFKASAGWLDNFKQRNGISHGRWIGEGTTAKDRRATAADYMVRNMVETMDTSGTLPTGFSQSYLAQDGALQPPATTQAAVNMAANTDVEMHEDQSLYVTAVGGSRTTPPSLTTSEVSSPAAVEDSVMHEEGGQQHMGIGLGGVEVVEGGHVGEAAPPEDDQAVPYTENQDHAYDHLPDRIPEPYGTPEPGDPRTTGDRVETMLDNMISWFDTQDILLPVERGYLARLKNVMLDYNSTGIIDRSRYS